MGVALVLQVFYIFPGLDLFYRFIQTTFNSLSQISLSYLKVK